MSAPLQWWHAEEALPGVHRPQPTAPAPVRVEWMRTPRPHTPAPRPPEPRGQRAAQRIIRAGEAGALWLAGVLIGCGLIAVADLIARSIG